MTHKPKPYRSVETHAEARPLSDRHQAAVDEHLEEWKHPADVHAGIPPGGLRDTRHSASSNDPMGPSLRPTEFPTGNYRNHETKMRKVAFGNAVKPKPKPRLDSNGKS